MEKSQKNTEPYSFSARYYDLLAGQDRYQEWTRLVKEIIKKYRVASGTCLDLACGTGRMSQVLSELGFEVLGVDKSPEMLKIAKKRLPESAFLEQDLRSLYLPDDKRAVFAVCFYDSLNYLLTDEEIEKALAGVARSLDAEGLFLFDLNTRDHVRVMQSSPPAVTEIEDCFAVIQNQGKGRFWELDMTFFVSEGEDLYRRVHERHVERAYDPEDIAPLLRKSGFTTLETIPQKKVYHDGKEHVGRVHYLVKKQ